MESEGTHDENKGEDGTKEEDHVCHRTPYVPSFCDGTYEARGGREGTHGDSNGHDADTVTDQPGEIVANGYVISATPEDRREPEPGQLTARIWIREIRPPALGPVGDSLDDFIS